MTRAASPDPTQGKGSRPSGATYDLRASQVPTPAPVVRFFWDVVHQHRSSLGTVLDMGAGDGRFSRYGRFKKYRGIEIDRSKIVARRPRKNATVTEGCVFESKLGLFDACVGNPPYLRHQDIESPWKELTLARLRSELRIDLSGHGNLFLYFMALALLRTSPDGLLALVVPFDWVSRPAARELRQFIRESKWDVTVYRFSFSVFDAVDTTASVTVIDKATSTGQWKFLDVASDFSTIPRRGPTGSGFLPIRYSRRSKLFARRGLAPGNQEVFTLTEGERVHHGLHRDDVQPCITSLRGMTDVIEVLDDSAFKKHFVDAGRRCWLVKCRGRIRPRVRQYLDGVPVEARSTATCLRQTPWYKHELVRRPQLLLHSAFTSEVGPRVLINKIGAVPVGSIYGIYGCPRGSEHALRAKLLAKRVVQRIVPHSRKLRKLEIGQANELLSEIAKVLHG